MTYTDETLMPWGIYKGNKMANIPADYLIWLYDNNKCDKYVRSYIEENLDVLRVEVKQNR